MASHPSPFPSPLFSEVHPPCPTPLPSEPSVDYVLLFFAISLALFILYFCCYPFCNPTFWRRNRRLNPLRDIEAGLPIAFNITQPRAIRVVVEEGLKTFQYTAEEPVGKNEDCCVCMEEFAAGDFCKMLGGCGHSFHNHCINPWLTINPHCPICRLPVPCGWRTETTDSDESSLTSASPGRSPA